MKLYSSMLLEDLMMSIILDSLHIVLVTLKEYIRKDLFNGERRGPFIMRTVLGNQTVTVNNDRTILSIY